MKAAVVIPPIEDFYFSPRRFASLGALTVKKILLDAGYEVSFLDFASGRKHAVRLPRSIEYLREFMIPEEKGGCSFFTGYSSYGLPASECAALVAGGNYDIVFVSLFAFCYADTAIDFGRELKKLSPSVKTVIGGAGASVFPDFFYPHFDFVAAGEAETVLAPLVSADAGAESGTRDLFLSPECCRENRKQSVHTKEGEFLPASGIAFSDKKSLNFSVSLTRGCPKRCRFCSTFMTHGRSYRKTDPLLLKELLCRDRDMFEKHRGKKIFINLEDDNLLCDRSTFFSYLEVLRDFFLPYAGSSENLFFSAENGLDYTLLDTETADTLVSDFSFRQFNFTLGSSSAELNSAQERYSDKSRLEKLLLYLESRGTPAVTYFIAGLENDSGESVVDSLLFLGRFPGLSGISMFYAVPGLPGFSAGFLGTDISPALFRGSSAYPWNNSLSTKQLVTAFRISRTVNFLKKETGSAEEAELEKTILREKKLFTLSRQGHPLRVDTADRDMEEMFFEKRG